MPAAASTTSRSTHRARLGRLARELRADEGTEVTEFNTKKRRRPKTQRRGRATRHLLATGRAARSRGPYRERSPEIESTSEVHSALDLQAALSIRLAGPSGRRRDRCHRRPTESACSLRASSLASFLRVESVASVPSSSPELHLNEMEARERPLEYRQHGVKDDGNRASEPALVGPPGHSDDVADGHGAGIQVAPHRARYGPTAASGWTQYPEPRANPTQSRTSGRARPPGPTGETSTARAQTATGPSAGARTARAGRRAPGRLPAAASARCRPRGRWLEVWRRLIQSVARRRPRTSPGSGDTSCSGTPRRGRTGA